MYNLGTPCDLDPATSSRRCVTLCLYGVIDWCIQCFALNTPYDIGIVEALIDIDYHFHGVLALVIDIV